MDEQISERGRELGGILPLFAILLLPLIGVVGLAIDVSLAMAAKSELVTKTEQAALGAISHYVSFLQQTQGDCTDGGPCCYRENDPGAQAGCAADQGVTRASAIAEMNLSLGERFAPEGEKRLISDFGTRANAGGVEGILEVGRYYWFKPCGNDQDPECTPCGNDTAAYPCFARQGRRADDNNAVRLTTHFHEEAKLQTRFMRALGLSELQMEAQAVATLLPRNDIFLIDLSRSVVRDTYLEPGEKRDEPTTGCPDVGADDDRHAGLTSLTWYKNRLCHKDWTHTEFAMELVGIPGGSSLEAACEGSPQDFTLDDINTICPLVGGAPCYIAGNPNIWQSDRRDWNIGSWEGRLDTSSLAPTRLEELPPRAHVQDEYRGRAVTGIHSADTRYFAIDHQVQVGTAPGGGNGGYFAFDPPQPLFDILDAAYTGVEILRTRKLSADKFGLRGFDHVFPENFTSVRHLPLSQIDLTENSNFMRLRKALDLDTARNTSNHSNAHEEDFISRGLFPVPGSNTDIHRALQESLTEIAAPENLSYQVARNSIFMFTDGQANCVWDPPDHEGGHFVPGGCIDNGTTVVRALQSILDDGSDFTLLRQLQARRISVSIGMVGGGSGAHFVARKSHFGDRCMDQIEAQSRESTEFVNTEMTGFDSDGTEITEDFPYEHFTTESLNSLLTLAANSRGETKFVAPNVLYRLVQATKGLWIPILPTHPTAGDFSDELNTQCGLLGDYTSVLSNYTLDGTNVTVTDANGRVLYDPWGRSPRQQLQDGIALALSSPFILAPSGPP